MGMNSWTWMCKGSVFIRRLDQSLAQCADNKASCHLLLLFLGSRLRIMAQNCHYLFSELVYRAWLSLLRVRACLSLLLSIFFFSVGHARGDHSWWAGVPLAVTTSQPEEQRRSLIVDYNRSVHRDEKGNFCNICYPSMVLNTSPHGFNNGMSLISGKVWLITEEGQGG